LFVGLRQVFVRFLGCNLACPYCDTPASLTAVRQCRVEQTPGKRDFVNLENPLSIEQVTEIIKGYDLKKHHSISYTGGEPLLQDKFLQKLIPMLKPLGPLAFLETNGTLPDRLINVIDLVDIISMDIKLTGETDWAAHSAFLRIGHSKQVYVKVVILPDTGNTDLSRVAKLIEEVDPLIPLILQPVTPYGSIRQAPAPARLIELQDLCLDRLKDVRVIPQTHKIMGQL